MKMENGKLKKYKLGELMEVTRGMSLSGEYYATEGRLIRLTLGNFDYRNNCFKDDKSKDNIYFTGDVKDEFVLNKDDIITPLTEQVIGLLGSTAKVPCDGKYIQSQDVGLIKCNEKLHPDFAFYLIPSKIVRTQLSATAQQTKIRHTSPDKIKNCTVWIPEYAEQEKIGNFIKSLDDKIALNRRINAKLEQMAKRLYDYWFVQFDFRFDFAQGKPNADGKPYKASGGKMVWNEVLKREIPAGWEVKRLGDIIIEIPKSKIQVNQVKNEGDIPFFTSGENILKTDKPLTNGTKIFLSTGGNAVIKLYVGDAAYSTDTYCIEFDEYTFYIYLLLKSMIDYINTNLFTGSGLKHLQKEQFKSLYCVLPPKQLLKSFNRLVSTSYTHISRNTLQQDKLTALRDRLLPLLMNGQVEVE